jgi:hypothetical protein
MMSVRRLSSANNRSSEEYRRAFDECFKIYTVGLAAFTAYTGLVFYVFTKSVQKLIEKGFTTLDSKLESFGNGLDSELESLDSEVESLGNEVVSELQSFGNKLDSRFEAFINKIDSKIDYEYPIIQDEFLRRAYREKHGDVQARSPESDKAAVDDGNKEG